MGYDCAGGYEAPSGHLMDWGRSIRTAAFEACPLETQLGHVGTSR